MADLRCDVAIIGAGIIGTSLAWHLAKAGCRNVVVVEKEVNPGLGSTAKAAGGIRAQFGSDINVRLSKLSIEAFERFGEEVGVPVQFNQSGYLWVATKDAELRLFEKNVALQRSRGLDVRMLSKADVAAKAPYLRMDDVLGGTFHQKDGYAPPADYVMGYHQASKALGVTYWLETAVTGIETRDGAAKALITPRGRVEAANVVCAAGAWSGEVGKLAGLEIPIRPVRRQCFVTAPIPELPHPIPMTVDYTSGVYMHTESGGVLVGLADKSEPPSFNQSVDPAFIEKMAELAMHRVPVLESASILTSWAGLYEMTEDHHPILGPAPGLRNFWIAAGFSGHGVMHGPATGRLMAQWILGGTPELDLRPLRWERFRERDLVAETHVI